MREKPVRLLRRSSTLELSELVSETSIISDVKGNPPIICGHELKSNEKHMWQQMRCFWEHVTINSTIKRGSDLNGLLDLVYDR